jgi:FtsH-binding integral membrane protein
MLTLHLRPCPARKRAGCGWLTQDELIEDPRDFIATRLLAWAHGFSIETKNFYAFYLLSHGVVVGMPVFWLALLAPLGLVFFLSFRIDKISLGAAQLGFWAYAPASARSCSWV